MRRWTPSQETERRGLTDAVLDAEMAAYSAERRDTPPAASKENGLAAEFRMIRRGRLLGGPRPKDLIEEDRDRQQTYGA